MTGSITINKTVQNLEIDEVTQELTITQSTSSLTLAEAVGPQGIQGIPGPNVVSDSVLQVYDDADATKILMLEVSPITHATTRTLTVPNADTTIVGTDVVQDLSNKTLKTGTLVNTGEYDNGNSGAGKQIDWSNGLNQKITISASTVLTFANPLAGSKYLIRLIQSGAGHTITFPSMKWPSGAPPTFSIVNGAIDMVTIYYDGASYHAMAGLNFA
jgi:hypothetical protein